MMKMIQMTRRNRLCVNNNSELITSFIPAHGVSHVCVVIQTHPLYYTVRHVHSEHILVFALLQFNALEWLYYEALFLRAQT